MVGRQRDNNLQHYLLGQVSQQPQTFYEFTDMPMYDAHMKDLSLSPGISLRCTTCSKFAFQQKKARKDVPFNIFPFFPFSWLCLKLHLISLPHDTLLSFGNSNHMEFEDCLHL